MGAAIGHHHADDDRRRSSCPISIPNCAGAAADERRQSRTTAVRTGMLRARALIYAVLILFAVYYLLPLYVMLVNSLKPLDEIRQGNMLALPQHLDHRALAQRLVDGADRRAADGPQALFHQLDPDGRAGGVRSRPCSARSTAMC